MEPARLRIVQPGLLTTVQDLGRVGYQRFGVSVSGAMDSVALRLGNRLVGNPDGAAALEVTLLGPVVRFETEALIALTGGELSPSLDGKPVPMWVAVWVAPGSRLAFGPRRLGARAYLAVAGGLDVPPVLGSRATHLRTATGGLSGRALVADDRLSGGPPPSDPSRLVGRSVLEAQRPRYEAVPVLRAVLGPQSDDFGADAIETLATARYTVSPRSDRMGYSLNGPPLVHAGPAGIVSDATPLGSVQVPGGGGPILLMADRQTTGGYPKIAVVISADLPLAAQLAPGDILSFALVTVEEARAAARAQEAAWLHAIA